MMLVEFVSDLLTENIYLLTFLGIIGSYFVTTQALPFIIYFSKVKNLTAKIDERSSHTENIPNIGGIGIIAGVYIVTLFLSFFVLDFEEAKIVIALFIPLLILLFIGFKDDMLGLSAKAKLLTEIGTGIVFILLTECRVDNFYGLFGIYEINYYLSIALSVFVFIITINSYNLIDGIDGLAGSYGILAMTFLLIMGFLTGNLISIILCVTIIGSLIGFLRFNLSSEDRKIFMGDTGSLVVGFLLSVVVLITLSSKNNYDNVFDNIPVIILAILSFPYIDTLRVMFIRKKQKRKFFDPDKNHIHHVLINSGYSHLKSSLIIMLVYTTTVLFSILTVKINVSLHFFFSLFFSFFCFIVLVYYIKKS